MNGLNYVTATDVCSDTGYRRPIHNPGTVMCQQGTFKYSSLCLNSSV